MKKYIIIAVVVAIVALLFIFRDKLKNLFSKPATTTPPAPASPAGPAPFTIELNYDKLLKLGVTGNEVRLLQTYLGVTRDSIFGPITEAALMEARGVKQITLNLFVNSVNSTSDTEGEGSGLAWLNSFFDVFSDEPTATGGSW